MKLSVIIPIFNAEKHLEPCVNSILCQDFKDFEILLVNDGSTDHSRELCEAYAAKDNRVRVFNKENGGVSFARNIGIENAAGEWITFVDADDFIKENYFTVLNLQSNTDWILLDMERELSSDMGIGIHFNNQHYSLEEFVELYSLYPHFPETWGKFLKRSIIKTNNLKFDENLKFGEDSLFNLKYLKFCKIISTSNLSKYVYNNAGEGLSKLKYHIKNDTILFEEIENELIAYKYPSRFRQESIAIPLTRYLKSLFYDQNISASERRKILKKTVEKYYNVCLTIYTDLKIRSFLIFAHFTGIYFILDFVLLRLHKVDDN